MKDPQVIFQSPEKYLDFITSPGTENQHFDRKAVRNERREGMNEARENLKECVSGFTNSRGGVIILGIADDGTLEGLNHLSENELNSFAQVLHDQLNNHHAQLKEWTHGDKLLYVVYCPTGRTGICKTTGNSSKGWMRVGSSNLPLSQHQEEHLIMDRRHSFEQLGATKYSPTIINKVVLSVFKSRFLEDQGSAFTYDDAEFLKLIGAVKVEDTDEVVTNAGLLFFGNNPTSIIPSAQVRILKYEVELKEHDRRGNPVFDKTYDGCLPVLLQKIRTFIKEGALFKTYSYRDPSGSGIIDELEFPLQAVEETIVNAIIHRDYNVPVPIECSLYKDSFVVKNPGRLLQPEFVPNHFSLTDQQLVHFPRNPTIVQWAKTMRDEANQRFVKALSEGYRTIRDQMAKAGLPAPEYKTNGNTFVALFNNFRERESKIEKYQRPYSEEHTNLFPIELEENDENGIDQSAKSIQTTLIRLIKDKFQNLDWFIDRDNKSRIVVHKRGNHISLGEEIDRHVRVFPAFSLQVYLFEGSYFLSIDFDIQVKNTNTLEFLIKKGIRDLRFRRAQIKYSDKWTEGIIEDFNEYYARAALPLYDKTVEVGINNVVPYLSKTELNGIVRAIKPAYNFEAKIKELSLAASTNASKERFAKISSTAIFIAQDVFPLTYKGVTAYMNSSPVPLRVESGAEQQVFTVVHSLTEPAVRFDNDLTEINILSGLTKFGAYGNPNKEVEIIPFCISGYESKIENLIQTIHKGSMNFKGLERTFKMGLRHATVISKPNANDFISECKRLLNEYRWEGNPDLNRLFLVHIPEDMYPMTDINSPYYTLKEFLLQKGIPVQMVNTPTLDSPKFKDLNLALNIVAKTGGTPWVLPAALSDADLFIGLSYSQYKSQDQYYRTMGYANVFDRYGKWMYYKGNVASFDFENKHIHLARLVKQTLEERESLPESPSIHIHYTSKFSRMDRDEITKAVFSIKPNATITFVWINNSHNIRMFDSRIEGNGSLSRGSYVYTGKNQFYLSTTGYNVMKKILGTPIMLEVNTRTEPFTQEHQVNHRTIAQHLLSLTKLNWASTQSINGEPVTTKYARDIAQLSSVFFRRNGQFNLHKVLEQTPWFI
jgi:predicted HTH transcriptional regulator